MKKIILSAIILLAGYNSVSAQDLPTNAEPGKCYVRCKTPDIWKNEDVTIEIAPAYKRIATFPAQYKTVTERVLVDEGSQKLVIVPAKYENQRFTVETKGAAKRIQKLASGRPEVKIMRAITKEESKKLVVVPAKYEMKDVVVVVKEEYKKLVPIAAKYEMKDVVVVVKEASKRLEVVPAKMKTVTEVVTIKEASKRLEVIPAKYEMKDVVVTTKEAGSRIEIIPAKYEMKDVVVVVKEASKRLEAIPAVYKTEKVSYRKKTTGKKLRVVPASLSKDNEVIEVRAKSAKWQMSEKAPDCTSSDPNDCRYWCYKEIPAQFQTINKTVLQNDATVETISSDCQEGTNNPKCFGTYTKRVLVTPPTTREIPIPEVTKVVKKRVMVTPPTTREIPIPAQTKVIKKRVMVTPPTTREIVIPAQTKVVKRTVVDVPASTREIVIPEVTKIVKKRVMVTPPTTREIVIPAQTKVVKKRVMVTPPTTREISIPEVTTSYRVTAGKVEKTKVIDIPAVQSTMTKRVMVTAPTTRIIKKDPRYASIKKTILVKDAYSNATTIPAKFKTITKEKLVQKGGLTSWKPVDCKLVNPTVLPINWNLGSYSLTASAKRIINSRLLPVLKGGVSVVIESHTDSRGSDKSNETLSERRAQAVVNYLITKGINPSQLTAKGYGERKLLNRCSNGVSCTEREHAANRRTTFRVIDQKN